MRVGLEGAGDLAAAEAQPEPDGDGGTAIEKRIERDFGTQFGVQDFVGQNGLAQGVDRRDGDRGHGIGYRFQRGKGTVTKKGPGDRSPGPSLFVGVVT